MGVRKYSLFLFQIGIVTYIVGAAFYLIGRSTYKPSSLSTTGSMFPHKMEDANIILHNDHDNNRQSDSYVINPSQYAFKMKVDLPPATNRTERQAAAFIVLVRNSELFGMLQSMNDVGKYFYYSINTHRLYIKVLMQSEERFNKKFNYPWIFLNEEPFTQEFIDATTRVASSKTHYGLVDKSMWGYPEWVDQTYAAERREIMKDVPYGLSESYRHMCRFQR